MTDWLRMKVPLKRVNGGGLDIYAGRLCLVHPPNILS